MNIQKKNLYSECPNSQMRCKYINIQSCILTLKRKLKYSKYFTKVKKKQKSISFQNQMRDPLLIENILKAIEIHCMGCQNKVKLKINKIKITEFLCFKKKEKKRLGIFF